MKFYKKIARTALLNLKQTNLQFLKVNPVFMVKITRKHLAKLYSTSYLKKIYRKSMSRNITRTKGTRRLLFAKCRKLSNTKQKKYRKAAKPLIKCKIYIVAILKSIQL